MKVVFLLVLAFSAAALAESLPNEDDPEGWFVPTVDGKSKWVTRAQSDYDSRYVIQLGLKVKFYLYTEVDQNSGQQIYLNDSSSLTKANFNKDLPTRIYIHGWLASLKSEDSKEIRTAFLQSGEYNVIAVDWSSKAMDVSYSGAKNAVPAVGRKVATFIEFLHSEGMSYDDLTVVGHSLGAHAAGFAGKYNGKLVTIIGLDPSYPLYIYKQCSKRLCPSDAKFVESIQTNGGTNGFVKPIGTATYYPNGGKSQPGCVLDVTGACAHKRSWIYFAESLQKTNIFPGMKCTDYTDAAANKCSDAFSDVEMGSPASYGRPGTFYVPVNSKSPFGMGFKCRF